MLNEPSWNLNTMKEQRISGVKDFYGAEFEKRAAILEIFWQHMTKHGYQGIETPILSRFDLYVKAAGETSDMVSKELYFATNTHSDDRSIVLRPEGTSSVISAAIGAGKAQEANFKVCYAGPMFRHNRPQRGRYRQHTQLGAEILNPSRIALIDNIMCLLTLLKSLQIDYALHLNILPQNIAPYVQAVTSFFEANIDLLNAANRTTLAKNPLRLVDQLSQDSRFPDIPKPADFATDTERKDFEALMEVLESSQAPFYLNPKLVRGLDYYSGPVFECVVDGMAIAGGGAYSIRHLKPNISGAGWGIGLERVLDIAHVKLGSKTVFVVTSLHEDRYALEVAQALRASRRVAIICEELHRGTSMASKCATAGDRVYLVCVGDQEQKTGSVSVKEWDVDTKSRTISLSDLLTI